MNRVWTVILMLAMIFCLASCGAADEATMEPVEKEPIEAGETIDSTGMPNPMEEYGSLTEINEKLGVNLLPPSDTGVTNEKFFIISGTIAHYVCDFSGREWTFRAAHITDEDISGVSSEYNEFEPRQDFSLHTNAFYLDRFFDGDTQYTIVVTDPITEDGDIIMGEDVFMDCCVTLQSIQQWHTDDPLVGFYQDRVGQRATAYVERFGDTCTVSVNWSDSADTFHCWTMYNVVNEGDKLTYESEEIGCYTYDADGNETSADVTNTDVPGFLEIKDGVLFWTGASQEECRTCEFEKVIYED